MLKLLGKKYLGKHDLPTRSLNGTCALQLRMRHATAPVPCNCARAMQLRLRHALRSRHATALRHAVEVDFDGYIN